jgi:hypothetical protein
MTTDPVIVIGANGIISFAVFFLLKHYLPSYFNEKGKNLATKEDIGEITKIIESVKLGNSTQLETLKTELSFVARTQEVIYDDERKAIIDFIGVIADFFESNIDLPNESSTPEGFAYMQDRIRASYTDYGKVQVSLSKLQLFCFEYQILDATQPILLALTDIQGKTQTLRYKLLGIQKRSLLLEQIHTRTPNEENFKSFSENLDGQIKLSQDFYDLKVKFHKEYYPKYLNLLSICSKYLKTKKALN